MIWAIAMLFALSATVNLYLLALCSQLYEQRNDYAQNADELAREVERLNKTVRH